MPLIFHKNGGTGEKNLSFISLIDTFREVQTFTLDQGYRLDNSLSALDPLRRRGMRKFANKLTPEPPLEQIIIDLRNVHPAEPEQVLQISGIGMCREKVYLSPLGEGSVPINRPQPNKKPHMVYVESLFPIRESGRYRRRRKGDTYRGDVIGWETHEDYVVRKGGCKES